MDSKARRWNESLHKSIQSAIRDAFNGTNNGMGEGGIGQDSRIERGDGSDALDFTM